MGGFVVVCGLIVAGYLIVESAQRDRYIQMCVDAVEAARAAPGCLDYSITADTVDLAMVRIFECGMTGKRCSLFGVLDRVTPSKLRFLTLT